MKNNVHLSPHLTQQHYYIDDGDFLYFGSRDAFPSLLFAGRRRRRLLAWAARFYIIVASSSKDFIYEPKQQLEEEANNNKIIKKKRNEKNFGIIKKSVATSFHSSTVFYPLPWLYI